MTFLIYIIYTIAYLTISNSELPNLLDSSNHTCISCACHAMTGCYSLQNCAKYSISYEYWERAIKDETRFSNIVVNPKSYQECITDDNCIINTIMGHAAVLNKKDCLCDEDFDCRDILILHLYGEDCTEKMSRTHRRRYNSCAKRNHKPVLDPNIECIDTSL